VTTTLQHHPKEDKQVSVLTDQGENLIYGRHILVILPLAYDYTARDRLLRTYITPLDARACLSKRQGIASIHSAAEKGYSRKLGFRLEVFSETSGIEGSNPPHTYSAT
jgi:hypothetical protein